jgi:hypothetical protein
VRVEGVWTFLDVHKPADSLFGLVTTFPYVFGHDEPKIPGNETRLAI